MTDNTLLVKDVLNGYRVDSENIQSVGNMTVVPIISDQEFTNVANINEVKLSADRDYGELEFANHSGKLAIVIQGWTIIDGQHAQDRTVPYAQLIKAGTKLMPAKKGVPANCVQAHQGGHFNVGAWEQENFMVLPPSLRSLAIKNSNYNRAEYNALWSSLRTWVKTMNCEDSGLTHFYSKHRDTLDTFVAQFEPVDKQLGAIVFINGELVAVDIMPKYETWKAMWRQMIRDSYGAEAIRLQENQGAQVTHPSIDVASVKTVSDLAKAFKETKDEFHNVLKRVISTVCDADMDYENLERIDELSMLKVNNSDYTGQVVMHGDKHFVYASIVKSSMRSKPLVRFKSLRNDPYSDSGFSFN